MALSMIASLRSSRLDAITTAATSGGASAAKIRLYTGSKPAGGASATATGTLLAELTFQSGFAAAATGGVLTLTSTSGVVASGTGVAAGDAGWFRLINGNTTATLLDGTVGTSGQDLNMPSVTIASTQPVQITSFTITEANT
jgi:hypothetical protein